MNMNLKNKETVTNQDQEESRNVDDILSEGIGQIGKYHCMLMSLFAYYIFCIAQGNSEYVFTTARINTRCLIPECDSAPPEFSPLWLEHAVPAAACSRYDLATPPTPDTRPAAAACPADMFNTSHVVKCDQWVYENHDTVVYEFDLGCDEWKRSVLGSVRTFGSLISMPITGYFSDKFGRRVALIANTINSIVFGFAKYWANSYWVFLILEFLETSTGFAGYTCIFMIVLELIGPKYRILVGLTSSTFLAIGNMFLALLAWAIPYWRHLTLVIYAQYLPLCLVCYLVPESFRWLMINGRYSKGESVLKKAARVNNKMLSAKALSELKVQFLNESKNIASFNDNKVWLPILAWRNKSVLRRCCIAPVLWITMTLTYYGISINAVNLSGNRFVNWAAASAAEIPGFLMVYFIVNVFGRKLLLTFSFWMCAVCMFTTIFVGENSPWVSLLLTLLGKFSIAMVLGLIYVYTAEIFPTSHRHTLFAFASMLGRLGSIAAPLTPALGAQFWPPLPYVLFAACCAVSGTLMLFMPETSHATLPDTMDQVI